MTEAGAWITHYYDGSDISVFATETEALRHAVTNGSNVIFIRYGESLTEALQRVPRLRRRRPPRQHREARRMAQDPAWLHRPAGLPGGRFAVSVLRYVPHNSTGRVPWWFDQPNGYWLKVWPP